MPSTLPLIAPLKKFSPRVLRKWLKCVNWYSAEKTPSDAVANRKCKFLSKFIVSDNVLCNVFKDVAMKKLLAIENNASY